MPGEAFLGVGLTPMSSLCERCALSLEVDRSEEHGRLRRIAVWPVCICWRSAERPATSSDAICEMHVDGWV